MTVFEAVKDRADPADVLALYWLHVNKANMLSCPSARRYVRFSLLCPNRARF